MQTPRESGRDRPRVQRYVATSLQDLKSAPTDAAAMGWSGREGTSWFTWTPGDHSGQDDDANIIKSDDFALSIGAWVRQSAGTLSYSGSDAPFIRTRSALEKLREIGSGVRDTGAIGDGRADDTPAIQEIADHFAKVGGEWYFPAGVFKTTKPLVWDGSKPQRIRGRGKRGVYPGRYDPAARSELAVLLPVHDGRAAIEFVGSKLGDGTLEVRGLALATLEAGLVPTAGFAWDTSASFFRDFTFTDCSVHGFTAAFDVFKRGGAKTEVGILKAHRCNINRNSWIARTLDGTQWNGFDFSFNEAGQNGYNPGEGGLSFGAHSVNIFSNCMEGMRDPIRISGSYRGIDIRSNYFESNVGRALIWLENVRGPFEIGPNAFLGVDYSALDHPVLLTNCGKGRCALPYRADGVHKMDAAIFGNASSSGDNIDNPSSGSTRDGFLRCDSLDGGPGYAREPEYGAIAKQRVKIAAREQNPLTGQVMPVAQYATAGSGAIKLDYGIADRAGQWVVMSWLMKRQSDRHGPADPYISFNVNGIGAPGSRDYVIYNFDTWWRDNEWVLVTAAIKLGVSITRLSLDLYPFGIDPVPGRIVRYLHPVIYTAGTPNQIIPYIHQYVAGSVPEAPKAGTWLRGDRLANSAVASGGQADFVCIADGTPGNWAYG